MSSAFYATEDTIVAIASATGPGLRGIVRLSGPDAVNVTAQVFHSAPPLTQLTSSQFVSGTIRLAAWDLTLPAHCLVWPGQQSFTRQPSTELHTWALPLGLEELTSQLVQAGARLAQPGEFTLRAFLAGRLDLTQAEAVLGVIDASGEQELQTSLAQLSGGLGGHLHRLRESLLELLAHLEAGLDFVEEDIEFVEQTECLRQLTEIRAEIAQLISQVKTRDEALRLPRVVLLGPPNVGKSSLFNAMCQEPLALVSEIAGTTRDFVNRRLDINQVALELVDTAGLDELPPASGVDRMAQDHTTQQADRADLVLDCRAAPLAAEPLPLPPTESSVPRIRVVTKSDQLSAAQAQRLRQAGQTVVVSSLTGEGVADLLQTIAAAIGHGSQAEDRMLVSTATRSRTSLTAALESLDLALEATAGGWGEELIAAEIRQVLEALGQVTGAVYTDDVLDRIFSRFCIGK